MSVSSGDLTKALHFAGLVARSITGRDLLVAPAEGA
jgi:hypothetical protein